MKRNIEERIRLARMTEEERIEQGIWRMNGGRTINIKDMTDLHIKRCISRELQFGNGSKYSTMWIKRFRAELRERSKDDSRAHHH